MTLVYKIDPTEDEYHTEKVHAKKIDAFYRHSGVPTFAGNLAYGDIVKVEFENNEFHFEELIEESGHSVLHIVIFDLNERDKVISTLEALGCGVISNVANNYLVIDIPPSIHYINIQSFLDKEESLNSIDYRESCLSKIHRSIPTKLNRHSS